MRINHDRLSIADVESSVSRPARDWVGRCHEIAVAMVRKGLCPGGIPVYGLWDGPISDESMVFRGRPITHHGWIRMCDGSVVDPTRWCFEGAEPYIYHGPPDHYDEGGNRFRMAMMGPPPTFDPDEESVHFTQSVLPDGDAWTHIERLLCLDADTWSGRDVDELSVSQLAYLANLPPASLHPYAVSIYRSIERLGSRAFIPIDNWEFVMDGSVDV